MRPGAVANGRGGVTKTQVLATMVLVVDQSDVCMMKQFVPSLHGQSPSTTANQNIRGADFPALSSPPLSTSANAVLISGGRSFGGRFRG